MRLPTKRWELPLEKLFLVLYIWTSVGCLTASARLLDFASQRGLAIFCNNIWLDRLKSKPSTASCGIDASSDLPFTFVFQSFRSCLGQKVKRLHLCLALFVHKFSYIDLWTPYVLSFFTLSILQFVAYPEPLYNGIEPFGRWGTIL